MTAFAAGRDVVRVLGLWRGQARLLAVGVAISVAALLCGVALTVWAGRVAVAGGAIGTAVAGAAILRALGAGRIVLRYVERLVTHDATFRALSDLRVWFFREVAASASNGIGFRRSGDLLSRLVGDVEALDSLYLRIGVPLAGALVLLPCLVGVIGRHDVMLAVIIGGLFAIAAFIVPALAASLTLRAGTRLSQGQSALRVSVLDAVVGLREVRVFGAEGRVLAGVQGRESRLIAAQLDLARRASAADAVAFVLGQAALLAVLVAAASGFGRGDAGPAAVAVFLVLASFDVASGMPRAGVLAGHAAAAARRVMSVGGADPAKRADGGRIPVSDAIRFENVSFGWRPERPVLRDLTLEIAPGSRIAVLGPSGAGKSTLANLMLGVARPDQGIVTLGDVDLASLAPEILRARVALLSQATHLFGDTIRANLLIGRRTASEPELWSALEAAAIADWVKGLPEGLDTWLGEAGATVSGGQGRRLALARALLSDAKVLVLDEPGSGLDAETERAFLSTLFARSEHRTIILIAHRLTGAERLDRVWRLSAGQVSAAAA